MYTQFARTAANNVARRTFATAGSHQKKTMNEIWLGDRGAYPVIGIMGFATVFCFGVGMRCLTSHPDVRIMPSSRNSVLRTWS
mmetsp:Transcript_7840/g.11579  ORF Transcript_7840/g.11579 Transcript_7840/m.11579 type:complete len:83 (-) Transcript_7840:167-415(-)